eukprot:3434508-Pleurochrysis_carterae.AAC.2
MATERRKKTLRSLPFAHSPNQISSMKPNSQPAIRTMRSRSALEESCSSMSAKHKLVVAATGGEIKIFLQ